MRCNPFARILAIFASPMITALQAADQLGRLHD